MLFIFYNISITFEYLIYSIGLKNFIWKICLIYLYDVITYRKTFEKEIINLKKCIPSMSILEKSFLQKK